MSDAEVVNIKCRILELFSELDEAELEMIEKWICSHAYRKDLENKKSLIRSEELLKKIGNSIKKMVPFEAVMPTEHILQPRVGDQADCSEENTCHVDKFLYDEKQVENLVKKGKLKQQYCLDCSSRNIKDLTYISHSISRQEMQYIFKVLLPKDLEDKQILDVGSRLGGVLYAAYYFTNASKIVGIEINKECCELQENVIAHHSMDLDRISIINSDVIDRPDIVECSDIFIMNVLDFFVDEEKYKELWHFFKKHIKKGSYLVVTRSMAETLGCLGIFEEFMDWLSICKPNQTENEIFFDVEEYSELYLYSII